MKFPLFPISTDKQIYAKPLNVPQSTLKKKIIPSWTLNNFRFCQQLWCNNFKTIIAMTMTRVIWERSYKCL